MSAKDERAARLAKALRDNLRRRKAQSRAGVPPPERADTGQPIPDALD